MSQTIDNRGAQVSAQLIIEQLSSGTLPQRPLAPRFANIARTFDRSREFRAFQRFLRQQLAQSCAAIAVIGGRQCDDVNNLLYRIGDIELSRLAEELNLTAGVKRPPCNDWPSPEAPLEHLIEAWPWSAPPGDRPRTSQDLLLDALRVPQLSIISFRLSQQDAPRRGGGIVTAVKGLLGHLRDWPGNLWLDSLVELTRDYGAGDHPGRILILCAVDRFNRAKSPRFSVPTGVHYVPIDHPVSRAEVDAWEHELVEMLADEHEAGELCAALRTILFAGEDDQVRFEFAVGVLRQILSAYQITTEGFPA